ncbi:AAA family ATPase [Mucilaginibacter sp. UR6-1]|uniref:AAA family ATPase n=1 Tax=Mucilaginibacter sp. UR6-1 TaxID=1435643 RepID=UPI001E656150|nr:AAA family ATPase [Mucilaginibacter sp. UR6-1]MCC8408619.1 AAA family ATPase [Mucilaginibacter sp. UR6-1]
MTDKLSDILASWEEGRNVLLYGPPATGKTRLISELFQILKSSHESDNGIVLDPDDANAPFSRPEQVLPIPKPVKVIWTTFHQSYGYEDFVLGLRPEITISGTKLKPFAGVFLDAALELSDTSSKYKSVVIFIDEINRGNAARIFGEFMTFLDFDYRSDGRSPLPIPLRQLKYIDGQSEDIYRAEGQVAKIPVGFEFPKHIYIIATMNSVDRAAVPIDSALARRFDRIEMRPDPSVLAQKWGLNESLLRAPTDDNWEALSPLESAYLILDRLNLAIAADLGTEFELGHGLLTQLSISDTADDAIWQDLAKSWDEVIYPQLEDRYSGRPEQLIELLRVDTAPPNGDYAWTLRSQLGSNIQARTLTPVRVSELTPEVIKRSFRWLTR